ADVLWSSGIRAHAQPDHRRHPGVRVLVGAGAGRGCAGLRDLTEPARHPGLRSHVQAHGGLRARHRRHPPCGVPVDADRAGPIRDHQGGRAQEGGLMRARTQSRLAAAASIALTVAIAGMVNYMAARHFRRSDWTRAQIYSLSDKTRAILSGLDKDLKITVFMIPGNDVYQFTDELLTQFRRYAPAGRLAIEMLDIDKQRDQAELLAKKYKIDLEDLRAGVVVFESGGKTKYVTKSELVEYDYRETPMGAEDQKVRAFKGEGAFASAVLTVTEGTQTQICFVKGHGEGDPEGFDEGGYASFAEELKRDNYQIKTLAALDNTGVPAACGVVVVGGPQRAWQKPEADALDRWLEGGGKAFLLVGPVFDRDLKKWSRTGLEDLLDKWGVKLGDNIVVDPDKVSPFEGPTVWATDTYGDHPAVKKLKGKITFWPVTREVRAAGKDGIDVSELVKTS